MTGYFSAFTLAALLFLTACKVSIDTESSTPVTSGSSTSDQSEEIELLKAEIEELKQLEDEINELRSSRSGSQQDRDATTVESAKKLVRDFSYSFDKEGFKYVPVEQTASNIGAVLSFEAEYGDLIGDVIVDADLIWMPDFLVSLDRNCNSVYVSSPEDLSIPKVSIKRHHTLCLKDDFQTLHTSILLNTAGVDQIVINEVLFLNVTGEDARRAFFKSASNARPYRGT